MLSMLRCKIKEGGKYRFMKAKTLLKFYDQRTINDQLRIILQEQYWGTLTYTLSRESTGKKKSTPKTATARAARDKLTLVKIYHGLREFNFYINFHAKITTISIL